MRKRCGGLGRGAFAILLLGTLACSRPGGGLAAQTDPADAAEAARTIMAADLRLLVGTLAHDSMRGRDTPSPELDQTARFVASRFEEYGLLPGAGPSYIQSYPLTFTGPGEPGAQELRIDGPGGRSLDPGDFVALPGGGTLSGTGPIVVASLENDEDLAGRVALVSVTQAELSNALGRLRALLNRGATGALFALDAPRQYFQGLAGFFARERLSLGVPDELPAPAAIVPRDALPGALREALNGGGSTEGYAATLRTGATFREVSAPNTIGWIQGSDPELRDEYVIFTAHMDHVGVGRPVGGDSIYNGADDDASGTAAVIELAQAFASLPDPPRRSLVFLTVSGEEKGLFGSRWYAEHPTFPIQGTVANLNIDMIGRNWRDTVVAIGREESTLGRTLEGIVERHAELGLTMIDDPWPDENFYFRSDHYNFARVGVPILFFFTGTHADYHRPGDEPDRLLYEKTSRIARLIFYLGLEVADADERPRWDPEAFERIVESGDGG